MNRVMTRGRKKTRNPKTEHIRISFRTRQGLLELKNGFKMPFYYKEGDVIEALILIANVNSEN